jgi:hypothetical protein
MLQALLFTYAILIGCAVAGGYALYRAWTA